MLHYLLLGQWSRPQHTLPFLDGGRRLLDEVCADCEEVGRRELAAGQTHPGAVPACKMLSLAFTHSTGR